MHSSSCISPIAWINLRRGILKYYIMMKSECAKGPSPRLDPHAPQKLALALIHVQHIVIFPHDFDFNNSDSPNID